MLLPKPPVFGEAKKISSKKMDLTLSICHDYHDYKILLTHGSAGDASSAYLADAAASSWSPSSDASRMEESDIRCLMMFNVMS